MCKSPHWQNSTLAPNSLKFLAQVGNRTQASRERLNLTRIKHRAQPTLVILMAVYPAQKHCEESTSWGTWVSTYFLIEQGSQPGLEPTTSRLLYRGSSPFTHCATSAGEFFRLKMKKGVGSGSISQRYESGDTDTHQNVTDPQHWFCHC
jgi:hypothetical protein